MGAEMLLMLEELRMERLEEEAARAVELEARLEEALLVIAELRQRAGLA